ncbi:MAG: hydroxymethylbilane synthase, partial [Acidimicrobiales bacterium]
APRTPRRRTGRGGGYVRLRIATRRSPLARWQAEHVAGLVRAVDPGIEPEYVLVETSGDRRHDVPIWTMGGKGVFVKEVEAAVLAGRADVAVHSAKDLPSARPDGLVLAAVPERGDPRDALVGAGLDEIAVGGRVATGSVRRRAQLADLRPDLTYAGLRGNIHTRLEKAADFDAIVLAFVALERLGLEDRAAEVLAPWVVVPQVGQGALAVECRSGAGDAALAELLGAVEHEPSRRAVDAERAFLRELGGDCNLPAGAHATVEPGGDLALTALLASLDGHVILRHRAEGTEPGAVGVAAARHLLDRSGGAALLAS